MTPPAAGTTRSFDYIDPHESCKDQHDTITLIDDRDGSRKNYETCTDKDQRDVLAKARMYGLRVEGLNVTESEDQDH